ncbi:MAG: N-acetylmuramoyl-L-alanine amidase [Candidatus Moraniibacteriota bacterium]
MNIKWIGANGNNFGVGRSGTKIDMVILHWIAGTLKSCDATFQSPTRLASAHYGVGNLEIHQYVKEEDTAWHAGNLAINKRSIGIENEGSPTITITDATYNTLSGLLKDICSRYGIPLDREHIKGHKEVSLKPTACPGDLDIDRVITLAKGTNTDMTNEQQNILNFLATQNANEGKVREAFGALADLPSKVEQIGILTEKVEALEKSTKTLGEKVGQLEADIATNTKTKEEYQSEIDTANEQARNATEQLGVVTDDRNKYRRLYEGYNDLTGWGLIKLGFQKLTVKK